LKYIDEHKQNALLAKNKNSAFNHLFKINSKQSRASGIALKSLGGQSIVSINPSKARLIGAHSVLSSYGAQTNPNALGSDGVSNLEFKVSQKTGTNMPPISPKSQLDMNNQS